MNSLLRRLRWFRRVALLVPMALPAIGAQAAVLEKRVEIDGTTITYKVVLPANYDPAVTYPGILVFGGGPQTMRAVDGTLERNFRAQAESRGYIVVAPAAPDDELYFRAGERIFPAFLDAVLAQYKIEGQQFHVAGPSNGGIAAFHVAARNPDYFVSITAFPGYMWKPTAAKLDAIAHTCVFAYIGEDDRYPWHTEMRREVEYLGARGTTAKFFLELDQPHRISTLADEHAARLFDNFDFARTNPCHREVSSVAPFTTSKPGETGF